MSLPTSLRLADQIGADILDGRLSPGARLEEAALAARYGCSRTPVREALRELCARGLAQRRAGRGVEVIAPDPQDLLMRFEALAELEALCAALAAHRAGLSEICRLQEMVEAMAGLDPAGYRRANRALHDALSEIAGNAELARVSGEVRLRLDVLRGAQLAQPERQAQSHAEHKALVAAIAARDAAGAAAVMRAHLQAAAAAALKLLPGPATGSAGGHPEG